MLQVFRTLRFRLVLIYAASLLLIQVIMSVLVLKLRADDLLDDYDERLAQRSEEIARLLAEPGLPSLRASDHPAMETGPLRIEPFINPDVFIEVRSAGGQLRYYSENLGALGLPFDTHQAASLRDQPALTTVQATEQMNPALHGKRIRQLIRRVGHDDEAGFVQVACDLSTLDARVWDLAGIFLTVIPITLLIGGGASYLMARRSLAPIGKIAREAQRLTAEHLDRRLPVPTKGDEVGEMVQTINQMLDRIEAAFRGQERFLSDAAHELRTPVTLLLGQAQVVLQRVRTAEEYQSFVDSVQDEMRQLARVVDSLLTLARADAGLPLPLMARVSLNEVATEAVQRCVPYARQYGVRLVPTLALSDGDAGEAVVLGDPELLVTLVANLLRNGIRYSPSQGAVEVEVFLANGQACIDVRDRGPGIPVEHQPQIFQRFYQVTRPDDRSRGMGLGLAIARGIVQMHRGTVTIKPRPEGGTILSVCVPVAAPEQPIRENAPAGEKSDENPA